jgi:hypothetical protein
MEIHREAALPLTADEALPQTKEIAGTDVLSRGTGPCAPACRGTKPPGHRPRRHRTKKTGKRRNLGAFDNREAAEKHEREVQYSSGIEEVVAIAIHH